MKECLFVAFAQGNMTYFESMQIANENDKIGTLGKFYDDLIASNKADYVVCFERADVMKLCKAIAKKEE